MHNSKGMRYFQIISYGENLCFPISFRFVKLKIFSQYYGKKRRDVGEPLFSDLVTILGLVT